MRKVLDFLLSRMVIVGLLILLQLFILLFGIWKISESFFDVYIFFFVISVLVVIYIVSRTDNPSYKLAWTIPVLLFPVFGGLFYLIFGGKKINTIFKKKIEKVYYESKIY